VEVWARPNEHIHRNVEIDPFCERGSSVRIISQAKGMAVSFLAKVFTCTIWRYTDKFLEDL